MVATVGLTGLRPNPEFASQVTSPPYDVIKSGTTLEQRLKDNPLSLFHVILGDDPSTSLTTLREKNALQEDSEPAYYVYEQRWQGGERTGVFSAAAVSAYSEHQIIRHEKTFDHKVKGRIALRNATDHSFGPVFVLTRAKLASVFARVKTETEPLYDFTSDFGCENDLHGIHSRVWRVPQSSEPGLAIQSTLATAPMYIADGHHRYHASLLNEQTYFLCYVTEDAVIQSYNRVVNGTKKFSEIAQSLELQPVESFHTPPKHSFCLYADGKNYLLKAKHVPQDVVGKLDCAILERELYPLLGLSHEMISDMSHFDYYPESALKQMQHVVDAGEYDLAIALNPVDLSELMAVADAGLDNPDIVMPEKSTFFAPKILSGLFAYNHRRS